MHSTDLVLASGDPGSFPSAAIAIGGLALLHGIALVLNVCNYAGWWQLIQEQYRRQHISLRGWHRIGWLCAVAGGVLLLVGIVRLAV